MIARYDIAIVGAGMAGASLAAEVAPHASVLLIEAEAHPGYHATGRSAAFWSETYGGPLVQPLTAASGPFLEAPPAAFHDRPFLHPRGCITLADEAGGTALDQMGEAFAESSVRLLQKNRDDLALLVHGLRDGWNRALYEPSCRDIDVAALHAAYLRAARRAGAILKTSAPLRAADRQADGWQIVAGEETVRARIIVNAAGAWADEVALIAGARPMGIRALRRTMIQLRVAPPAAPDLPLVMDALGRFYFKPEGGGRLWLSPHDETPCPPCDAAPEEVDVARAIAMLERVADWRVEAVERKWAGLRSFAPDRLPVYGFAEPGFFWFAGQGGFGIQTAPAGARMGAALLLGMSPDPMVSGLDPARYAAQRFKN